MNSVNKFFKLMRMVRLEKGEKNAVRDNLVFFMNRNPVISDQFGRQVLYRSNSLFSLYKLNFSTMPLLIILALFVGGGASFAAEGSIPGDILYPVKVNVNEKVGSWVRLSDEAEARWNVRLVEERLIEAEELAANGKLDADARVRLEANFERHANKVESRISALSDADAKAAADIVSNLKTSLSAHDRILLNIGVSLDGQTETEINLFLAKIRKEKRDAENTQKSEEREAVAQADVESAARGRMNAAENKIDEVEKYINKNSKRLSAAGVVSANTRLTLAKTTLAQGKVKLDAKAYAEAFVLFGKAHGVAQEAKLLVQAKIRFEDDDELTPTPTSSGSPSVSPTASPMISPSLTPSPTVSDTNDEDDQESRRRVRIDIRL